MNVTLHSPRMDLRSGAERVRLEFSSRSRHNRALLPNRFEPENIFSEFRERDAIELSRASDRRNPVASWRAATFGMVVGMIGLDVHGLQEPELCIDPVTCSFALVEALANNINDFAESEQEALAQRPMRAPDLALTTA